MMVPPLEREHKDHAESQAAAVAERPVHRVCSIIFDFPFHTYWIRTLPSTRPADGERRARTTLKINWINPILEAWAFGLIKLSLSLLYRRVFGVWPAFRRVNNVTICLLVAYILTFSLGHLFLCGTDFYLIWLDLDQHTARERCAERGRFQWAFALVSVLTDLLVLGLPLVFVGQLKMSARKRWTTASVILLGFISTFASITRFFYRLGRIKVWLFCIQLPIETGNTIPAFACLRGLNPTLLAMIEMGLGLWSSNLTALAPLLQSFHPIRLASGVYRKVASSLAISSGASRRPSATSESEEKVLRRGASEF